MKLSQLSLADLKTLAKRAGTSLKYAQHLATGRRHASAAMAGAIEKASGGEITRDTLCAACKSCPHLKASRKSG
jgi:DNA-binding transcriptional regulator YdaS (Cro superfamily)